MVSAVTLQVENEQLRASVASQDKVLFHQQVRIKHLEEQLYQLRHAKFGASSEQISVLQGRLFDEVEEAEADAADELPAEPNVEVRGHQRRSNGRPKLAAELPRVEVIYELDEADRMCGVHGCEMDVIGAETSEQVEYIPARIEVKRNIRRTYACPECAGRLVTAPMPKQPIPKSMATPSLLAFVAVSKYADALPLYRQCQIFERLGFKADRTTLANWMIACGRLIQPLINLMWDEVRSQRLIHMDETSVQVLKEANRPARTKSYMWVCTAGPPDKPLVLFEYHPSRSRTVPIAMLDDFGGVLMVDGYKGYDAVCRTNGITRLGCWAHARRKFVDAQRVQPKGKTGKPDHAITTIGDLYRIERAHKASTPTERYAARQSDSKPILDALREWLDDALPTVPPKTTLGKALLYLNEQWPRLVGYIEDGGLPIDNNRVENAIRPFVVGRKNWLFAQTPRGAQASANLYSLIETAKGHGLEPTAYLRQVFAALPNAASVDDFVALLPANIAARADGD